MSIRTTHALALGTALAVLASAPATAQQAFEFNRAPIDERVGAGETCVDILKGFDEEFAAREGEAQTAMATLAAAAPLVLKMRDGSIVDLRGETDVDPGPTENWFGDPPRQVSFRESVDAMRGFAEADNEAECIAAARALSASLREWEGLEPLPAPTAGDAMTEGSPTENAATGDAATEDTTTGDAPAGDAVAAPAGEDAPAEREARLTPETDRGGAGAGTDAGDTPLTDAEAAAVSATADDTGEGDDYGAPAATKQADVTGEDTEAVESLAETNPDMGEGGEDQGEVAALETPADDAATDAGTEAGAATPLQPMTTSDETAEDAAAEDAAVKDAAVEDEPVEETATVVGSETADGAVATEPAPVRVTEPASVRMTERPGRIIIETPDGQAVDPNRGLQFRKVPIE